MNAAVQIARFLVRCWYFAAAKYTLWVSPILDKFIRMPLRGCRRILELFMGLAREVLMPRKRLVLVYRAYSEREREFAPFLYSLWNASVPVRFERIDIVLESAEYSDISDFSALTRLTAGVVNLQVAPNPEETAKLEAMLLSSGCRHAVETRHIDSRMIDPHESLPEVSSRPNRLTVRPIYRNAAREWLKSLGSDCTVCAFAGVSDRTLMESVRSSLKEDGKWLFLSLTAIDSPPTGVIDACASGCTFSERLAIAREAELLVGPPTCYAVVTQDAGGSWVDETDARVTIANDISLTASTA